MLTLIKGGAAGTPATAPPSAIPHLAAVPSAPVLAAPAAAALAPPDDSPAPGWSKGALGVVGLCFAINMVDGLDVTIMSYIAPALPIVKCRPT